MLDLKAKLLQAGLVTKDQVEKVEEDEKRQAEKRKARREAAKNRGGQHKGSKNNGKRKGGSAEAWGRGVGLDEAERWKKRVEKVAAAPKSEQYDVIRGWVDRTRLNPATGLPSEQADRFHFTKLDGSIGWLTLEPPVVAKLSAGEAGVIAYMSHSGLRFCVVPTDMARDVQLIRPEWLRHLVGADGEPIDVVIERPRPKEEASEAGAESASESVSQKGVELSADATTDATTETDESKQDG